MKKTVFGCAFQICLTACVTEQVKVPTAFDFSKVRRISIEPFDGQGAEAATDEFVKDLVQTGIEVTDARHPGDLILKGTVVEYKANNQLTVFLGDGNPVVSPSTQALPEGAAVGAHKSPIATVIASVSIQARLLDPSRRRVLWADNATYEGLDLSAAMGPAVSSLVRSMGHVLPQLSRRKS